MADEVKKRVTTHRGRKGKNGVYSPKHNDRQFDTRNAEHIDGILSVRNQYRKYNEFRETGSFEEHEKAFYDATFGEALAIYNDKQIRSKHPSRVKTMDEYRRSERTCPEEVIMQIGNRDNTISAGQLHMINMEFIRWHEQAFPQFKLLDYADHFDEPDCAPHGQLRGVWVAYDDKGNAYVSQKDALAQMGIHAPNPDKKIDRYNNPKMTYTATCRAKMIDIAMSHGIEIEDTPREASKSGLDLSAFKLRRTQEEYSRLRADNERLTASNTQLTADNSRLQAENGYLQARNGDLSQQVIKLQAEKEKAVQERTAALQELSDVRDDTAEQVQALSGVVQKTAKPKRKGLFQKPDTVEVPKAEYDDLQATADNLTRVLHTNKAVSDDAARAAEQERLRLEKLKRTEQQKIQREAERIAEERIAEAVRKARSDERRKVESEKKKADKEIQHLQSYKDFVEADESRRFEYLTYTSSGILDIGDSVNRQQYSDKQFGD